MDLPESTVPLRAFGIEKSKITFDEPKRKSFCSLAEMLKIYFGPELVKRVKLVNG
jgi:hypothetical protein